MPLTPETQALLANFAGSGIPPFHKSPVPQARAVMEEISKLAGPGPEMHSVEDHVADAAGSSVPVRVLTPSASPRGVIVYLHGGGWVVGTIDGYEALGRQIAAATDCTVVLADYRLAPEHPFPAALDDSWAATRWAAGKFAKPLVVAGDSAGGNLAAVVALRAKAQGVRLAAQVLVYPVTDAALATASYAEPENQLILTTEDMVWFWDHYVPAAADRASPEASPLRAEDLAGLPPALVLTAGYDVLRDEGEAYARRLAEAGVAVEQKRFPGDIHGFFGLASVLPSSRAALDLVSGFLDRTL